jgi:hypothetical protein
LRLLAGVVSVALACRGAGPSGPPALRADERILVDLYVRISQIESRRADEPDSVGPALDRLRVSADSAAVGRALAQLEAEPVRWQYVFDAIAQRLQELEEDSGLPHPSAPDDLSAPERARSPSKPRIP